MWRQVYVRLRSFFRWRRQEVELDEEIRFHLGKEKEERIAEGLSPAAARAAAQRDFGNVTLIRELTRETWGWGPAERLLPGHRGPRYGECGATPATPAPWSSPSLSASASMQRCTGCSPHCFSRPRRTSRTRTGFTACGCGKGSTWGTRRHGRRGRRDGLGRVQLASRRPRPVHGRGRLYGSAADAERAGPGGREPPRLLGHRGPLRAARRAVRSSGGSSRPRTTRSRPRRSRLSAMGTGNATSRATGRRLAPPSPSAISPTR